MMARPKLRVLMDLSMAARGYCGISQDVRLLYRALARCPDLEVTGLVYTPQKLARPHQFCHARASRADRLANQAEFLWKLAQPPLAWPEGRLRSLFKQWRTLSSNLLARRVQLDRLDSDKLRGPIWRMLFEASLGAEDFSLAENGEFLLSNLSDGMIYSRALTNRRPLKLDTTGYDFLIVQGPRPFQLSAGTRQIARYHDMIPVLEPDTMANPWYIRWHHRAIAHRSAGTMFVCDSEPTRDDLTTVYPELREHSTTIGCMLTDIYYPDRQSNTVERIVRRRRSSIAGAPSNELNEPGPYLLSVSTLEPRKNYVNLIEAFDLLRSRAAANPNLPKLRLLIVGNAGWRVEPIIAAMREQVRRGEIVLLEQVSAAELRVLYSQAEAFVFPSHAEGFGLPPMEAMQCGAPVVASDIAVHRWVMGDAAWYANPYDVKSLADVLQRLLMPENAAQRAELVARGRQRVERYAVDQCLPQWLNLFDQLKRQGPAPRVGLTLHPGHSSGDWPEKRSAVARAESTTSNALAE